MNMNYKKHIIPFALVLTLSMFALKPYFENNSGALSVPAAMPFLDSSQEKDDDEGWFIVRHKLHVKPKPPTETLIQKREQNELLARYHQ